MRRALLLSFFVVAGGSVLPSCGTATAPPVYVEATWQVRCLRFDGTPMPSGCSEPPVRAIYGYNGTDQQQVACSIRESGTLRTINFRAFGRGADGVNFGIVLQNATIPVGGGTPGASCMFSFTDGNVYQSSCGGLEPSPTQPCQIGPITFGTNMGSPTMVVPVYCVEAPASADGTIHRGATQPGSGMGQPMDPFTVTFYDCPVS